MDHLENQPSAADFKVALFYETRGRIKEAPDVIYDTSKVKSDMKHIAETFFGRPNYLTIDGRPVFYVYLTRWLNTRLADPQLLNEVIDLMKQGAADAGYTNVYFVGDHAYRLLNHPSPETIQPLVF